MSDHGHRWPPEDDDPIVCRLNEIDERLEIIMATLADLLSADTALGDEINQVLALVQQDAALIASLQGAIGSGNLSADQQAQVDNLFAQINAQHDAIATALAPPAAPAPPADVPPVPEPAP